MSSRLQSLWSLCRHPATVALIAGGCLGVADGRAQSVATVPVGAVTLSVAAGTGTARKLTSVSIPLLMEPAITGVTAGAITSLSATTLGSTGAGWQAGQLSVPAAPHLVRIMTGAARGRTFLISTAVANTAEGLTLDATEPVGLVAAGVVVNDRYEILAADTLGTLLQPADGVLAGASAAVADNVLINKGGVWSTYFYSTAVTPNRWTRVALGNPEATHEVIRPDTALLYSRLGASALNVTVLGRVPSMNRCAGLKSSGLSFLAQGWPLDVTLASLRLESTSGWVSHTASASADRVQILSNGTWKTYYHDGANWRQIALGSPIRNTDPVAAGAAVLVDRRGTAGGYAVYAMTLPYGL